MFWAAYTFACALRTFKGILLLPGVHSQLCPYLIASQSWLPISGPVANCSRQTEPCQLTGCTLFTGRPVDSA